MATDWVRYQSRRAVIDAVIDGEQGRLPAGYESFYAHLLGGFTALLAGSRVSMDDIETTIAAASRYARGGGSDA